MKWNLSPRVRRWLILPPVVLGVVIVVLLARNRRELPRTEEEEISRVLSVIAAPEVDLVPRVLGYGTAEPGEVWRAVAEVRGRVVETHPELESGALIQAGQELLRIDPTEYELTIKQLKADILQVTALLASLGAQEENDRASLAIEQEAATLLERELARLQKLAKTSAAAAQDVDVKERELLVQKQKVQTLKNALNLVPAHREELTARQAVKQAQLDQAEIDLKKTVIRAPFDCRLAKLQIEKGQFVSAGETLFEAQSTALTEVEAQVPFDQIRNLLDPRLRKEIAAPVSMDTVRELFQIDAKVRIRSGGFEAEWDGRFDRVREQIDPRTRTVGLVIAVDRPYEKIVPGVRPPLLKGAFCEVELRGKSRPGQIVVPRTAVWDSHVYLVDKDSADKQYRLRRRAIEIEFAQSGLVCVRSGVKAGELVVVTDEPGPLAVGMLVEPKEDEAARKSLIREATGEGDLR